MTSIPRFESLIVDGISSPDGPLRLTADPLDPLDAATKEYVDSRLVGPAIASATEFPPADPTLGQIWFNPATKKLFVWVDRWTEVVPQGPVSPVADPMKEMLEYVDTKLRSYVAFQSGQLVKDLAFGSDSPAQLSSFLVDVSDVAPPSPVNGQLWFDSVSVQTYIWYVDGAGTWVPVNSDSWAITGGSGGTVPTDGQTYGFDGQTGAWNPVLLLTSGQTQTITQTGTTNLHIDSPSWFAGITFDIGNTNHGQYFRTNRLVSGSYLARWVMEIGDDEPELGGNSGCNFILENFDDNGNQLGTPISCSRATGIVTLNNGMISNADTTVYSAAGTNVHFIMDGDQSEPRPIRWSTLGTRRWAMSMQNPESSTSGVGSDWALDAYQNDGTTFVGRALQFTRATGLGSVLGNPTAPLGIATKQYVDSHIVPFPEAPTGGGIYGRQGSTSSWVPVMPLSGGSVSGNLTVNGNIAVAGGDIAISSTGTPLFSTITGNAAGSAAAFVVNTATSQPFVTFWLGTHEVSSISTDFAGDVLSVASNLGVAGVLSVQDTLTPFYATLSGTAAGSAGVFTVSNSIQALQSFFIGTHEIGYLSTDSAGDILTYTGNMGVGGNLGVGGVLSATAAGTPFFAELQGTGGGSAASFRIDNRGTPSGAPPMMVSFWDGTVEAGAIRSDVLASGDPGASIQVELFNGGPQILTGHGAPAITRPNGSLYINAIGGTGTRVYVSSGSGWTAIPGV